MKHDGKNRVIRTAGPLVALAVTILLIGTPKRSVAEVTAITQAWTKISGHLVAQNECTNVQPPEVGRQLAGLLGDPGMPGKYPPTGLAHEIADALPQLDAAKAELQAAANAYTGALLDHAKVKYAQSKNADVKKRELEALGEAVTGIQGLVSGIVTLATQLNPVSLAGNAISDVYIISKTRLDQERKEEADREALAQKVQEAENATAQKPEPGLDPDFKNIIDLDNGFDLFGTVNTTNTLIDNLITEHGTNKRSPHPDPDPYKSLALLQTNIYELYGAHSSPINTADFASLPTADPGRFTDVDESIQKMESDRKDQAQKSENNIFALLNDSISNKDNLCLANERGDLMGVDDRVDCCRNFVKGMLWSAVRSGNASASQVLQLWVHKVWLFSSGNVTSINDDDRNSRVIHPSIDGYFKPEDYYPFYPVSLDDGKGQPGSNAETGMDCPLVADPVGVIRKQEDPLYNKLVSLVVKDNLSDLKMKFEIAERRLALVDERIKTATVLIAKLKANCPQLVDRPDAPPAAISDSAPAPVSPQTGPSDTVKHPAGAALPQ